MRNLLDDMKYALRLQAKNPGFTLLVVLILALGIGATTTVFSVLDAIMLKPLPYPEARKIVLAWRLAPSKLNLGYDEIPWGIDDFHQIAATSKCFDSLAAFKPDSYNLAGAGDPVFLEGARVSWQFFRVLGVRPAIGRTFTAEDDTPGHEREAILSYSLWRERFHEDRTVLDRSVNLNGQLYTVIGVMPAGFSFPRGEEMPGSFGFSQHTAIWTPLALPPVRPANYPDELAVMGRLKQDASVTQAQAQMNFFRLRMEGQDPSYRDWYNSRVKELTQQVTGSAKRPLWLTLAAVFVVLAIACSNIANLLLARSLSRGSEFALRAALGAGKGRLARQLLCECLLLAIIGGVAGVVLAGVTLHSIAMFGPSGVPRLQEVKMDLPVLAFALACTLASGVFFGLAPALAMLKQDLNKALREGGRGAARKHVGARLRNALLVFEVALALVLVIASTLLTQTFIRLLAVDLGFKPEQVMTFALSLPASKYHDGSIVTFHQQVLDRLRAIPSVEFAGLAATVPMDGATDGVAISIPGRPAERNESPFANYTVTSPGYLSAVRTPLLRGRDFSEHDLEHSSPVTIINQEMARKFWGSADPIGRQLSPGSDDAPRLTIIGVAANVKHLSAREETGPEMYVPFTQKPFSSMSLMHFVARGRSEPKSLTASVRSAVHYLDPDLPIIKPTTLAAIVDSSLAAQRFSMWLLAGFSAISLVLAACGLYGTVSYSVSQRTREIGVRLALGAKRRNVLGMIVGQGALLASVGMAIGLLTAASATRLMTSFLYGVQPTDTWTFLCVPVLLMAVTLAACYVPARRAAAIDPMAALRQE